MRKVFLDDLPKKLGRGINKNKECIIWEETIGIKGIKFIYDDIEGVLEIVDYIKEKHKLNIKYNNKYFLITTSDFLRCGLGELLGTRTIIYKYNIGDIIETKTGKIEILEQIRKYYKNNKYGVKSYKYKCLIDENIDEIVESQLINGTGCNICCPTPRKALKNYNDLWTTHPYIAKYLKYPEIGYNLTFGSGNFELFVCPECGYEKEYRISTILRTGFCCPRCSDGLSYPNKFAFNLLEQLNLNFIPEYSPDWVKPRKYDFYFEFNNKGYILEMDGRLGHGNYNNISGQTAEESQAIDDYKDKKAKENGIEVIRVKCEKSEFEFIKENIILSKLNELFDLLSIDWLLCEKFALSSRIKEACNYWHNGIKSTIKIGNIMKLSHATIGTYLKKGTKIGWCEYDVNKVRKYLGMKNGGKLRRKIIQLSLDDCFIKEWNSIREAQILLETTSIWACLNNKCKTAGKFKWMYKEDYEKYIEEQNKSA